MGLQGVLFALIAGAGVWVAASFSEGAEPGLPPNWRRFVHAQWLAGLTVALAFPSWEPALFYAVLCGSYLRPEVEPKSAALEQVMQPLFIFGAMLAVGAGAASREGVHVLMGGLLLALSSVGFWVTAVWLKGHDFQIKILGRRFHCMEFPAHVRADKLPPNTPRKTPESVKARPTGRMMNPTTAGSFAATAFFAGLGAAFVWHPAFAVFCGLALWVVWRTRTLGASISIAAGGAAWALADPGTGLAVLAGSVLAGAFLAVRKIRVTFRHPKAERRDWEFVRLTSWRLDIWRESIRICLGRPNSFRNLWRWAAGQGPGSWSYLTTDKLIKYGKSVWTCPHNEYVHILCEHGLLGLGALFIFVASLFVRVSGEGGPLAAAWLGMSGSMLGTAFWLFPWRGTMFRERATGRQIVVGEADMGNGKKNIVFQPEIVPETVGGPAALVISVALAALGYAFGA